ncbi:uncharacterized protein DEA37_0004698 [Paragonimus westermani]|uniref:Malectin domain-containing protein n=1 Tax=Paragonimus westermani TaxID=34504 RepID=A0A5J4NMB4_9TREM|nr:uncharacterized protein DEA37_0004698 [Paragonimus westermani]
MWTGSIRRSLTAFGLLICLISQCLANADVVWAVNCGGPAHVDVHGIEYLADPLSDGIASDYGMSFTINRIPLEDQILYQTERYNTGDFTYEIPFSEDGDYVLSLMFSEVYFSEPNQKCLANADVVWAVNCGGPAHVDVHGIEYLADPLSDGIASDYGMSFTINRIPLEDQILYQTERYNTGDFTYEIPFSEDGDYVLSLMFSEVYFSEPNQKVFHVQLNREITIVSDLDIFNEVGFATALERHIPFQIVDGVLQVGSYSSTLIGGVLTVDFIKTDRDNPKVNAIILTKGSLEVVDIWPSISVTDVPKLAPFTLPKTNTRELRSQSPEGNNEAQQRRRPPGSPRAPDPYASTESSYLLLPILGSLIAAVPILFCLCKI